ICSLTSYLMTLEKQIEIANSFFEFFEVIDLDIHLTPDEFRVFENGIFANSMDDKWNIFVVDDHVYFARTWTDYCIYKVHFTKQKDVVILDTVLITKNRAQFNTSDFNQAKIWLLKIIQWKLNRYDLYVDPEFDLELIKKTISIHDPNNECKKSIGHQNVGLVKSTHNHMSSEEQ